MLSFDVLIAYSFVEIQIRMKPHRFWRMVYITFTAKVDLATYTQNQSFLLAYQPTPQPPIRGGGPTTLYIYLTLMSIKPLWSSKEIIQTHTFFFILIWSGGGLTKYDKKIILKGKAWIYPKPSLSILLCESCNEHCHFDM